MKTFIISIISLFLFFTAANAQSPTFAPPGAEWYNFIGDPSSSVGVFHCYYDGDTVIDGITARKVAQKAIMLSVWSSMGFQVYDHPRQVVYNNADTVFMYNTYFHKFTPLYVFNVSAGDTLTLPVFPPERGVFIPYNTDSVYRTVIDSVAMVNYSGSNLRTVYTHMIDAAATHDGFSFVHQGVTGAYIDVLGHMDGGITPVCANCVFTADDRSRDIGRIKCYNDATHALNFWLPCGVPPAAISDVNNSKTVIYPQPADNVLKINLDLRTAKVALVSMSGIKQPVTVSSDGTTSAIDLSHIAAGIYMLDIVTESTTCHSEITVVH